MIRRRLIFGVVFLTAGVLFLLAPAVYLQRPRLIEGPTQNGWTEWYFNDPTDFGACARLAGLISAISGFAFLASSAISAARRRSLQ
jgi:hypothetical protein